MFSSSKRESWGVAGQELVTRAHKFYVDINSLVETKQPAKLETIESFINTHETIDDARIAYKNAWADSARADSKSGGSYTMLFTAVHVLLESATALWAAYALEATEPGNEVSESAFKVFRATAENAWGNSRQLPAYGYKVSQQNGFAWSSDSMSYFTNANLHNPLSSRANTLDAVPDEWFPTFG